MKTKYIVIGLIVLAIVAVGVYFYHKSSAQSQIIDMNASSAPTGTLKNPQGNVMRKGRSQRGHMISIKGTKLIDNTFLNSHAYLIYPVSGSLPADTQKAVIGWKIDKTSNADGSITVTLTPRESELEDRKQTFTVKSGEKLYFVELNLKDDQNGQDENTMDDIGIIVDQNGIIQNELPKPPKRPPQS